MAMKLVKFIQYKHSLSGKTSHQCNVSKPKNVGFYKPLNGKFKKRITSKLLFKRVTLVGILYSSSNDTQIR